MNIDFKVRQYNYEYRNGNLKSEAKGNVKSTKYFPYYIENNKKMIFKPLSKTKPFSTPYFAYSEVVWSNLLNEFFDYNMPIYKLARCINYDLAEPKYHEYGTIVESLTKPKEELVNLYEYFEKYPDEAVNISNYINYCLMLYDYSFFFESKLFRENKELAKEVANQILYSILRADENYHYENVSLVFNGDEYVKVACPIDHEFSSVFMYVDQQFQHNMLINKYIGILNSDIYTEKNPYINSLIEKLKISEKGSTKSKIITNIDAIVKLFPELVNDFIRHLNDMINYLQENPIVLENYDYIEPFSSNDFEVGIMRYKKNNHQRADEMEKNIEKKIILPNEVNDKVNEDILLISKTLNDTLTRKLK